MMGDSLIVIIPLLSLILASLSIAGLWYWWTASGEEETPKDEEAGTRTGEAVSLEDEATVGDLAARVGGLFRSILPDRFAGSGETAPAPAARRAVAPASPQAVAPVADGEAVEVLRILRDLADGGLIIEVGGLRYRSLDEIPDPQIVRRLVGNAQDLAHFAQLATTPAEGQPYPPPPPSVTAQSARPSPAAQPKPLKKQAAAEDEEPPAPQSMAEEIEDLLQMRLQMVPSLAYRSIHIHQAPGGGVSIEVDGQHFDSITDIKDGEVQSFIQTVIQEWEARQ
jgi:hypothetical protein